MTDNSLRFDLPKEHSSIIKVIGVGGGGSNAVNYMYEQGIKGVDFIVCNTDAQALDNSPVPIKIQLGSTLTEGRGAGSIPEVGKNAAIESLEDVRAFLGENTNMVFITAGMGGGTGTGAAPVIARVAKEMGILTVGIVTIPFMFEGRKRSLQADFGIKDIRDSVDTLLVIRNDKLRELYGNLTLKQAFSHADEVLCTAAKGIAEVLTLTGTVNVDMNDVKTVMKDSGVAIMGSARARGEGRGKKAVTTALESPLLNDNDINGANFILLNITFGSEELLMDEISEITDFIQEQAGMNAEVIWGYGHDESLGEDVCVTVIATGFKAKAVDTGVLRQEPEQTKIWLENDAKELVARVNKPTGDVPAATPEEARNEEEPFIKSTEPEISSEIELSPEVTESAAPNAKDLFAADLDLPATSRLKMEEKNEEKAEAPNFLSLEGSSIDEIINTSKEKQDVLKMKEEVKDDRPPRSELIQRNKEREMRIREFTIKLKSPNGISDLENEPAYMRRKVTLENTQHSSESNVSRFTLSESTDESGEKKTELRENNSFLHDNVD